MKRYLGSSITAYAAIAAPCLSVFCVAFGVFALTSEISFATCFLFVLSFLGGIIWVFYIKKVSPNLYSWGYFGKEKISVSNLFSKSYEIKYVKCKSVGIALYYHGFTNHTEGIPQYFIYFSYDRFDEKYKIAINHWCATDRRVKVGFDKKLYNYLCEILPDKQANMLRRDYQFMILNK